jgi:pseudolysin
MIKHFRRVVCFSVLSAVCYTNVSAATAINLSTQPASVLQSLMSGSSLTKNNVQLHETKRSVDFKQTAHVRIQQTYAGYPVMGADAVVHIPHGTRMSALAASNNTMNGTLYNNLDRDLVNAPAYIFTDAQAQKALQAAIDLYDKKTGVNSVVSASKTEMLVFIDKATQKAHYAYRVSFYVPPTEAGTIPAKPVYIIDAITLQAYVNWNDIKTLAPKLQDVKGGGFGGNEKMGQLVYDGQAGDLGTFAIKRDAATIMCYMQNDNIIVRKYASSGVGKPMSFSCRQTTADHGGVYWNGNWDAVNGGYSPANDALFSGQVIIDMYKKWYDLDVLTSNGKPMVLDMSVHYPRYDNAYWDEQTETMTFGDGYDYFYPLTSLGVAAHEISHGFTAQHSNLAYYDQSGGMNESYSDMAAQAAEVYAYGVGKNSWQIGPEIFKEKDQALRYMDEPTKDCKNSGADGVPGRDCSIDKMSQYNADTEVHNSSGLYNRLFYLISESGWGVHKTFQVMIKANSDYWTSNTDFASGAGCLIKAAEDYGYDVAVIKAALDKVEIKPTACA